MLIEALQLSTTNALVLAAASWLVYQSFLHISERIRIYRKGGLAAACRTRLWQGFDFIYEAAQSQVQDKDILFWDRLLKTHANRCRPYTVEVKAAGRRIIYTADPDNIKAVLADQFNDYGKGSWLSKEWRALFGHSILATDGHLWQAGRKMIRAQLSKEHISDFATLEKHTQRLTSALATAKGNAVDVKSLFSQFTLDHGTEFLLGQSTDTMVGDSAGVQFGDALDECQRFVMLQAVTGKVGLLIPKSSFHQNLASVNNFVNSIVERTLALSDNDVAEASDDKTFNFAHSLISHTRDPVMLRDQLLAVLIGARDTTACCLSWLFYALSQHPHVCTQLREEIVATVGIERAPSYSELKDMQYLQSVIKETLRLYPSVPYDIRWALADTSLPRGGGEDGSEPVGILKSTPIVYSIQYLHLSEQLYENAGADFPDPCSFAPHRWASWHPDHWTYLPFNGGPRLCVGQQFALTEVAYVTVRILQLFDDISWMGAKDSVYPNVPTENATLVERFLRSQRMPMHSEIVLAPHGEMNLAFRKSV